MASIPVTLVGSAYLTAPGVNPLSPLAVTIVADMSYSGLSVGGGPIQPPQQPPGQPPHPAFPIAGGPGTGFPDKPGYPPVIGGGPIIPPDQPPGGGKPPEPTFPIWGPPGINFPDKPGYPPTVGGGPIVPGQPPAEQVPGWEAKAVWTPETGWAIIIVPKPETEVPTPSA